MRTMINLVAVLALCGVAGAQALDRGDPSAVASAFIEAYKARDLKAMAPLVNANNTEIFARLAAEGPSGRTYDRVFSGWRAEAVDGANGVTGPARLRRDGAEALVPIGQAGGETFVIVLTDEAAGWAVEDINSPSSASFEALPTAN